MNKIWLVAKNTYLREVKTWSYVLLVLSPIILLAVSIGIGFLTASSGDNSDTDYVGVVTELPEIKQAFKKSDDFENYTSLAKAQKAYHNDDIDGYVVVDNKQGKLEATYHSNKHLDSNVKGELIHKLTSLQQALNIAQAKLSVKQLRTLQQQVTFKQRVKKSRFDNDTKKNVQQISFWLLIFVLYFLVLTYTQVTSQDVATEKGTKVMEVIFSSMPGGDYFTGKILGILGEIITHVLIYIFSFIGLYFAAPNIPKVGKIFSQNKTIIDSVLVNLTSWGLIFVILGLLLCIIFAAFSGALVTKAEDANKAVQPISTVILVGFILSLSIVNGGSDTIWVRITSYIPLLSSFIMPIRIMNGSALNIEAVISAMLSLGTIIASFIWIRRIYPKLILQTEDVNPWQSFKRGLMN